MLFFLPISGYGFKVDKLVGDKFFAELLFSFAVFALDFSIRKERKK